MEGLEVITKSKFRIVIHDVETGKSKCVSVKNHKGYSLDEMKSLVVDKINSGK